MKMPKRRQKQKQRQKRKQKIVKVDTVELEGILRRVEAELDREDYDLLKALVESYVYVTRLVEDKSTTIARLRKLLFGSSSEKIRDVLKATGDGTEATAGQETATEDGAASMADSDPEHVSETPKREGHGRNGADDYHGAERVPVPHESLESGDPCPDCQKGKVYEVGQPGVLVRVAGQAPVSAKVYELQKLRCNLCGKIFTAQSPEGVGTEKYDATAASMIALLKYGSGLPFNRLEGLQGSLGIPLPASTQWDIVNDSAKTIEPVYDELIRQAAQGEIVYNDDTTMKILELMGKRAKAKALAEAEDTPERAKDARKRTGVFTSGIVSTNAGRTIALFFTGRRHAGENLAEVLRHRASELNPPIQMCDALSRNDPKGFETILAHCNAHGRRQFVDVAENFPDECRYVLETLAEVYKNDAVAREGNLSPDERLRFHQTESGPRMKKLEAWFNQQFEDRRVEPNSGLGEAISYMLKHWDKLTLFLREPGAPLDNNITERALKRAILHRKNALFYRSENGARVGDLFMSLIHTCQLCDANPFDYLTELLRHAGVLSANPREWMPWNYGETLELAGTTTDARDALPHTAR
jgi:transposase